MPEGNLKYKIILSKIKYLNYELEDTINMNNQYAVEFSKYISMQPFEDEQINKLYGERVFGGRKDDEQPEDEKPDDEQLEDEKSGCGKLDGISPEVKKIYKLIMIATHPDKHSSVANEEERAKLLSLYDSTNNAISKNNISKIINIAIDLDLDISDLIEDSLIKELELDCERIVKEIGIIKSTYPWVWKNTDDAQLKKNIAKEYIKRTKR